MSRHAYAEFSHKEGVKFRDCSAIRNEIIRRTNELTKAAGKGVNIAKI